MKKENFTRFERARIIGTRALQISRGAPALIKTNEKDPIRVAELEFEQGLSPLGVKRRAPLKTTRVKKA
ncbi:MAG: DNA-directed RNA polymerase subunit K [Candidatus Aenigmatarchaeota archaeon]